MTGGPDRAVVLTLAGIAAILVLAWAAAGLARRLRQPPVVGEILVGIAVGPSLLGLLPGDLPGHLFPAEGRPFLQVIAQLGVVLFMFVIGLEFEPGELRERSRLIGSVAAGSIALPFGAGLALAIWLQPRHAGSASPTVFALIFACAMAMTAFPVLARIVADADLGDHLLGRVSLPAASIIDLAAWLLLAAVLAVTAGGHGAAGWWLPAGLGAFVLMLIAARRRLLPALLAWARERPRGESTVLVVLVAGALASAGLSAFLGLHAVIGAFAFGLAVPRGSADTLLVPVRRTVERMSLVLLPVFFVVTGFGVDLGALGAGGVVELMVIVLVASLSKLLGAGAGALAGGASLRDAAGMGALMNARGLTELIVLQVGRDAGVLDDRLFTAMTVMAVVTTMAGGPLLALARRTPAPATAPALLGGRPT